MTVTLHPEMIGLDADHPVVLSAVAELMEDARDVDGLSLTEVDQASMPGHKGAVTDLVIALGGPSVIAGAVRVFHLWLRRDKLRSLTLVRKRDGEPDLVVALHGENISEEVIKDALNQVMDQARP